MDKTAKEDALWGGISALAALEAVSNRHPGRLRRVWAYAAVIGPERGETMFWKKKKAKPKVELVSVETEEEFHAALDRGADVELTHELAEKVGLMVEDVGTLEEIKAARFDPYN